MRLRSLFLGLVLSGCASLGGDDKPQFDLDDVTQEKLTPVAHEALSGLAPYSAAASDKSKREAEWIACRLTQGKKAKGALLVMHRDRAGYDKARFCGGWIAQTFLSLGFDVLTVNRPGYGGSSGSPDFSGSVSLRAVAAGVKAGLAKIGSPALRGVWGYGSGAMAAALVSRELDGLAFAFLGGGVYDLEATLKKTSDTYLRQDIETIRRTGGNEAVEDRSIAYDVSGLPKQVIVYHGRQDSVVAPAQAQAFADSLKSSGEYDVNFQMLDGVAHEIPWRKHRRILEVLGAQLR